MSIDFRVRDFFYPIKIWKLHRAFERNQWAPPADWRAFQLRRLEIILDHAFQQVPYYQQLAAELGVRRADFQGPEDLRRLPLLTKEIVRRRGRHLVARNARRFHPRTYSTTGTSGEPLHFLLDAEANALEFVYYWRHWGWGGFRLGTRFAEISNHYFLCHRDRVESPYYYQPHLRRLLLNGLLLAPKTAGALAHALQSHRIRFLKGLAGALHAFVLSLREAGWSELPLTCVFSTGEVLTPWQRAAIESFFRCRALDSYGHMERTVAVSECPAGGYHVNEDYGLLQLEHSEPSNGRPRARVIGTGLYNRAMPLLRYEVGDEVEPAPDETPCSCGRTFPLIRRVLGRSRDVIRAPDGRYVTGLFLVAELVPELECAQFVQVDPDRLLVSWAPSEKAGDEAEAVEARLRELVRPLVGPTMHLEFRRVVPGEFYRDQSGKVRPVVNLCSSAEEVPGDA
ncbi:MAG: phenylacetate--CoA ligase family protein [Acidobacteriota bacterium]